MTEKPTCEELEKKIRKLEQEKFDRKKAEKALEGEGREKRLTY